MHGSAVGTTTPKQPKSSGIHGFNKYALRFTRAVAQDKAWMRNQQAMIMRRTRRRMITTRRRQTRGVKTQWTQWHIGGKKRLEQR